MAIEVLVFEVEGRKFALPSLDVTEVVRAATLSPVPQQSACVEGLLNLRGRILPVVDLRRVFQLPARAMEYTDHLVVVQTGGRSAALRVDQALDLVRLQYDEKTATESTEPTQELVAAVGSTQDGIVHVLDTTRILAAEDAILLLAARSAEETPV